MGKYKNEAECLESIQGRVIKSIGYTDFSERVLTIETQDGLKFEIKAKDDERQEPWLEIEEVG